MKENIRKKLRRAVVALWLPALAAGMAGCSHDDGPGDGPAGDQIRFTAGIATRTTNGGNEWVTGDQVGIFMFAEGKTISTGIVQDAGNLCYKPASEGSSTTLVPAEGNNLYWPSTGAYDFIAYYPYRTATGDQYTVNVSDQTQPEQIDILWAKTPGRSRGMDVPFTFRHVMSKIRVNILLADGVTAEDIRGIRVDIVGIPTTASLQLDNGQFTDKGTNETINLPEAATPSSPEYISTFEGVLIPDNEGVNRSLSFTFDNQGVNYDSWSIPDNHPMESGKVRIYELTLGLSGVTLTGSRIIPWEEDQSPTEGGYPGTELTGLDILEEANSYMMEPNSGPVLIPVSRANKAADPVYNLGAEAEGLGGVAPGNYTVETVWGDNGAIKAMKPFTYLNEGYIYIESGSRGNAVIAIRDKESGTIKWSWHIWVLSEKPGSDTDPDTGLTWMDRNLGAAGTTWDNDGKNGLYYQWGRKDAFPGVGLDPAIDNTFTTLSQLVQNPGVFTTNGFYEGSAPNTSPDTNSSWGESGQKTIYDPCPPGWRVPPIEVGTNNSWGTLSNWDSFVNYGRIFKGVWGNLSIYFPAAGYRYCTNGVLTAVGSQGYYWSATVSSQYPQYASTLRLHGTTVYPISNEHRGYGFSVRCVAE